MIELTHTTGLTSVKISEVASDGKTMVCGPGDHLIVDAGIEHTGLIIEPGRLVLLSQM